jgi:mercuric ion transport protein
MEWFSRAADKAGVLGSVVTAASCPACFPALASLGAAMGLGFLDGYEGLFITTLMPMFAGIALVANAFGWFRHRQWWRSAIGMLGPAVVLAAVLLFFGQWWTARLLYTGLALMVGVSLWDLLSPSRPRCSPAAPCGREAG